MAENPGISKSVIRLGDIVGEHQLVQFLRGELCGDLREAAVGLLSDSDLRLAMKLHPLHVKYENGRLLCVSGLKTFRLLKASLPVSSQVEAFVHEHMNNQELRDYAEFDLLVTPALWSVRSKDKRILGRAWERSASFELFAPDHRATRGRNILAKILACDKRTLEEK